MMRRGERGTDAMGCFVRQNKEREKDSLERLEDWYEQLETMEGREERRYEKTMDLHFRLQFGRVFFYLEEREESKDEMEQQFVFSRE